MSPKKLDLKLQIKLAHSAGFEPATPGSVDRCSIQLSYECIGGEGGIRTLDGLVTHTRLAGERLQPLGHLSKNLNSLSPH